MKSPWLWIVGIIIVLLTFSGEEKIIVSVPYSYDQTPQVEYQPKPTYQSVPAYSSSTFMGYPCTVDCSGHEAGYAWAEENMIDGQNDCDGNSASFIEGCQAYVAEQQTTIGSVTEDE